MLLFGVVVPSFMVNCPSRTDLGAQASALHAYRLRFYSPLFRYYLRHV